MGGGGISEKDELGDVGYKAVLNNLPSSLKRVSISRPQASVNNKSPMWTKPKGGNAKADRTNLINEAKKIANVGEARFFAGAGNRRVSLATGTFALYDEIDVEEPQKKGGGVMEEGESKLFAGKRLPPLQGSGKGLECLKNKAILQDDAEKQSAAIASSRMLPFEDQFKADIGLLIAESKPSGMKIEAPPGNRKLVTALLREQKEKIIADKKTQIQRKLQCPKTVAKSRFFFSRRQAKKKAWINPVPRIQKKKPTIRRRISMEFTSSHQRLHMEHTRNMQAFEQLHQSGNRTVDRWPSPKAALLGVGS